MIVVTPLLLLKQKVLTLLRWKAEQILPMEHGLNAVMPWPVEGFMMYFSPASQVPLLRGQHCCAVEVPSLQVELVQSCTAPKVCPVSCLVSVSSICIQIYIYYLRNDLPLSRSSRNNIRTCDSLDTATARSGVSRIRTHNAGLSQPSQTNSRTSVAVGEQGPMRVIVVLGSSPC